MATEAQISAWADMHRIIPQGYSHHSVPFLGKGRQHCNRIPFLTNRRHFRLYFTAFHTEFRLIHDLCLKDRRECITPKALVMGVALYPRGGALLESLNEGLWPCSAHEGLCPILARQRHPAWSAQSPSQNHLMEGCVSSRGYAAHPQAGFHLIRAQSQGR